MSSSSRRGSVGAAASAAAASAGAATVAAVEATGWNFTNLASKKQVAAAVAGLGVLVAAGRATSNFESLLAEAAAKNGTLWTNPELQVAVLSYATPFVFAMGCFGVGYCAIIHWRREEDEREARKDEREARKDERKSRRLREEDEHKSRRLHEEDERQRGVAFQAACEARISKLMDKMSDNPEAKDEVNTMAKMMLKVMDRVSRVHGLQVSEPFVADNASDDESTTAPSSKPSKRSPK
jgi:hypothetical protein